MKHLNEEELILHYYSEESDVFAAEQHLDQCEECRAHYASLQRVLNVVDSLPVPVRGENYGGEVWRRIEEPAAGPASRWSSAGLESWKARCMGRGDGPAPRRRCASLVVVAFLAGQMYPGAAIGEVAPPMGESRQRRR